jgi:hypothetical protein
MHPASHRFIIAAGALCALLALDHSLLAEALTIRTHQAGAIDELDCLQMLPAREGKPARVVLGAASGIVHVYEEGVEALSEVWSSRYMEGSICGLVVTDVNDDGLDEIVVFTDQGSIHYLDTVTYNTIWSIPPGDYEHITAHLVTNVDEDPQPELLFCAGGRLIIFDGRDQFEEWRSDQTDLVSTDILVADVDGDDEDEIVLNDGYVFDARFRTLEWHSGEGFGQRMGVMDLDDDGILELIGEYRGRFIRVFDVDLRREKSLRANY